jgi:hypothetical protein
MDKAMHIQIIPFILKVPKIKMKIIRQNILPPKGFLAINLFGYLFCKPNTKINGITINHEQIHTE